MTKTIEVKEAVRQSLNGPNGEYTIVFINTTDGETYNCYENVAGIDLATDGSTITVHYECCFKKGRVFNNVKSIESAGDVSVSQKMIQLLSNIEDQLKNITMQLDNNQNKQQKQNFQHNHQRQQNQRRVLMNEIPL